MADLEVFSKWMFKELIMFNKLPILPVISFSFRKLAAHCDQKWIQGKELRGE